MPGETSYCGNCLAATHPGCCLRQTLTRTYLCCCENRGIAASCLTESRVVHAFCIVQIEGSNECGQKDLLPCVAIDFPLSDCPRSRMDSRVAAGVDYFSLFTYFMSAANDLHTQASEQAIKA